MQLILIPELQLRFFRVLGRAAWYRIHDLLLLLGVNNTPICRVLCSQIVWRWLLDTSSRPSVVYDLYRVLTYSRSLKKPTLKIFSEFLLQLWLILWLWLRHIKCCGEWYKMSWYVGSINHGLLISVNIAKV